MTTEPLLTSAAQPSLLPDVQAMPGPVTMPVPVPAVATVRRNVVGWKVAVTVFAADIVAVQVLPFVLVQPDQLFSMAPAAGDAVSVTVVPLATGVVQPAGSLHSSPAPAITPVAPYIEAGFTVRGYVLGWNVAVTLFAPVIETVQLVPDTLVQLVQDLKMASAPGAATRVMLPPFASASVQSPVEPVAQAMPGPVTVPFPDTTVVSGYVADWNVAVTVFADVTDTVQPVPDTLVQPVHDLKMEPPSGVAVSVTLPPFATASVQSPVEPVVHAIPGPVTVPFPDTTVVSG
jgi:hypothetical protein